MDGAGLRLLTESVCKTLRSAGIGPGSRVAIVLPNGPEMATAFLTIASSCCAAPLNPAYTAEEFGFYLSDLQPVAIVLAANDVGPARDAASRLQVPVLSLHAGEGAAGSFQLDASALPPRAAVSIAAPRPSDTALVLHTSGTTARPKIVPLSNGNIAASARNIADSLALSAEDICLNVMPLFHIHGLIAAVSAAGASPVAPYIQVELTKTNVFSVPARPLRIALRAPVSTVHGSASVTLTA